jgi:hypothetical protein
LIVYETWWMNMARGKKVSKHPKIDVIVTSARYTAEGRRLMLARGYRRLGPIWTDLLLFDRKSLSDLLQSGMRIAAGRRKGTPGDFVVLARIVEANGRLATEGSTRGGDDLGVPLF